MGQANVLRFAGCSGGCHGSWGVLGARDSWKSLITQALLGQARRSGLLRGNRARRVRVLELGREFLPASWNICPEALASALKTKGLTKAIQMQTTKQRRCWAEDPFKGILGWARSASPSSFFLHPPDLSRQTYHECSERIQGQHRRCADCRGLEILPDNFSPRTIREKF